MRTVRVRVTDDGSVVLDDPDDCNRFSVLLPGSELSSGDPLRAASVGWVADESSAFVSADAVRFLAAGAVGQDWDERFAAMLDVARSRGWLDEAGTAIQAHIER